MTTRIFVECMNFNEIMIRKYTFYFYRANIVDDWKWPELFTALKQTYTAGSKTAVFYHRPSYYWVRANLSKTEPPKLLDNRYLLLSSVFAFPPHHFLFDIFNRKLQQYIEADLVNYNLRSFFEEMNPKQYEEDKEPFAILTFGELEAGFVVCTVPLIFSILVFEIEWLQTLKDLVVFLFIFKTYFNVKESEQKNKSKMMNAKIILWQTIIRANRESWQDKPLQNKNLGQCTISS